jgi:hypothetical protein
MHTKIRENYKLIIANPSDLPTLKMEAEDSSEMLVNHLPDYVVFNPKTTKQNPNILHHLNVSD